MKRIVVRLDSRRLFFQVFMSLNRFVTVMDYHHGSFMKILGFACFSLSLLITGCFPTAQQDQRTPSSEPTHETHQQYSSEQDSSYQHQKEGSSYPSGEGNHNHHEGHQQPNSDQTDQQDTGGSTTGGSDSRPIRGSGKQPEPPRPRR